MAAPRHRLEDTLLLQTIDGYRKVISINTQRGESTRAISKARKLHRVLIFL